MELVSRLLPALALATAIAPMSAAARTDVVLAEGWRSAVFDADAEGRAPEADRPFERTDFDDSAWQSISVPHNWQGYAYNRQVVKGARHGSAWYRMPVEIAAPKGDERVFLMFEGVNSYATVWLNGREVGKHGGGLTSFTLDVTEAVRAGRNLLAVRVDNPAGITDLPWVSGDDQPQNGFAEGSQPFGLFRPVHVMRTSALRVRPFGLFAWGDKGRITAQSASLTTRTELQNLSARSRRFDIVTELLDPAGRVVAKSRQTQQLAAGAEASFDAPLPTITRPRLWSPATPTLYTLRARIMEGSRTVDETSTPFGLRSYALTETAGTRRLTVNGKPFFVRGTAEYEHLLGNSHAFSPGQIAARVAQVQAAGFNAFRDAHYPHNLLYGDLVAQKGMLWWPQFSAHIWFDNPAFRANFKALLADWVRERRNNPALFLWGLQNESVLPPEFAREAMAIIRELDPTASIERLIVTCNGGEGSDWNVPQNWSGTYGGNPDNYAQELVKQGLVGEYGAWRSLEMHGEQPYSDSAFSEDRFAALMAKKARLADSVADRSVGDFQWLLTTHENPGRPMRIDGTQIWDGVRPLDHVGPANNKGLMTLWGEPLDAYYMYRALHVPAASSPMVYLVSHTWPDRWEGPGIRSGIEAYSNCDAVELRNGEVSLGRRERDGSGTFRWDGVAVRTNRLSAQCLQGGRAAAEDAVLLNNLPAEAKAAAPARASVTAAEPGRSYLYRVNVGGPEVVDSHGQHWAADRHRDSGMGWGWRSWADAYGDLDPGLGSRRPFSDLIDGTADDALFRSLRYGREQLEYSFAVPEGRYRVELYFIEPWYGRAGIDAKGWRRFDVAVNGSTVLRDLDVFAEAGFGRPLRRIVEAESRDGRLVVTFPRVDAGQGILSAIAVSAAGNSVPVPVAAETDLVAGMTGGDGTLQAYLDNGQRAFGAENGRWSGLPAALLDSDWVRTERHQGGTQSVVKVRYGSEVYRTLPQDAPLPQGWTDTGMKAAIIAPDAIERVRFASRRFPAGADVEVPAGWPVLVRRALPSPYAPGVFSLSAKKGVNEAEKGTLTGGSISSDIKGYGGSGFVRLTKGRIEWPYETGIAARHGLSLRYALPTGAAGRAVVVTLLDSSGIAMSETRVPVQPGEGWQIAKATTATAVNAGKYTVRLSWEDGAPLAVDSLTIE